MKNAIEKKVNKTNRLKSRMKSVGTFFTMSIFLLLAKVNKIFAVEVTFNEAKAKTDIGKVLDPVLNVLVWLVPTAALISAAVSYIGWAMKDEDERENSPFSKNVKRLIGGLIGLSIVLLAVKWFVFK